MKRKQVLQSTGYAGRRKNTCIGHEVSLRKFFWAFSIEGTWLYTSNNTRTRNKTVTLQKAELPSGSTDNYRNPKYGFTVLSLNRSLYWAELSTTSTISIQLLEELTLPQTACVFSKKTQTKEIYEDKHLGHSKTKTQGLQVRVATALAFRNEKHDKKLPNNTAVINTQLQ